MASTALGKLQGQGLIETTTAGLQQTGAQLATTPMGATMQGRTPSSVKMAGTQPSKVNALAAGMQDVSSVALAGLRETSRIMEGTDAEKALADRAQRSIPLGRVDDVLAKKALSLLQTKLGEFKLVDAKLDVKKLQGLNYNQDEIDAVQRSVNDLLGVSIEGKSGGDKAGFDTGDVEELNRTIKRITGSNKDVILWDGDEKTLPSTYTMATAISQLFTNESKESMQKKISDAMLEAKAETTISSLASTADPTNDGLLRDIFQTPEGQPTPSHDELVKLLAGITGKTADEINKMQIEDVTAAIKSWKESEFKDVAKLRETLQSKDASYAQQQLARKELRRLGQIGITAAAEKAGDLEKQIQEGDTISFGGKEWTYEQMFSDPTMIDDLSTWVSNPESAPAELRDWVKSNQDAIANKITELLGDATKGLTEATARVTKNKQDVALPVEATIDSNAYEAFFPGWDKGSLDPHSVFLGDTAAAEEQQIGDAAVAKAAEKALKEGKTLSEEDKAKIRQDALNADPEYVKAQKYKLLQAGGISGKNIALLLTNLTGLGQEGKDIFKELTIKEMQQLSQSDAAVNTFMESVRRRQAASAFNGTFDFKSEFVNTMDALGLKESAALFVNLDGVNLAEFRSVGPKFVNIFEKAGLGAYLKGNMFDLSKLTDEVRKMGKLSTSDLVNQKDEAIKTGLSNLHAKLTKEFGEVENRTIPVMEESQRDGAFARTRNPYGERYEAYIERLDKAAYAYWEKEVQPAARKLNEAKNDLPPKIAKNQKFIKGVIKLGRQATDEMKAAAARAQQRIDRMNAELKALEDDFNAKEQKRYNNYTKDLIYWRNNKDLYNRNRQTEYDKWWKKEEKKTAAENAEIRRIYAKLQSIFTTGAA